MEVDQPVEHGMTLSENKDGCSVVLQHFLVCMEATIQGLYLPPDLVETRF